jgi:hypothetical protein
MAAATPGFTLAERTWIGFNQGSSWWAQLLPFIAGVGGIVAIYFLVRFWGLARWLALSAALVVATSPIPTQYSAHVKEYSTDFLLACLVLWRGETARRSPTKRSLIILGLDSAVAVVISAAILPVIVGCWAAVLFCHLRDRDAVRRIVAGGIAVAAFLGLVYLLFFRNVTDVLHRYWVNGGAFLDHSSIHALWDSLSFAVSVLTVGVFAPAGHTNIYGGATWTDGRVFLPAALLVIVLCIGATARGRAAPPGLTLLAAVGASLVGTIPLGTGRTDEVLYPAIVLLAALGLHQIVQSLSERTGDRRHGRIIGSAVLGLVVILFAGLTLNSYSVRHPNGYPEVNVRQLTAIMKAHFQPGDWVLVDPYTRYDWTLYEANQVHVVFGHSWGAGFTVVSDQPNVFLSPSEPWEDGYNPHQWVSKVAQAGRLWYFGTWYLNRNQDPVYQALLAQGWKPRAQANAAGGFAVLMTQGGLSTTALIQQGVTASDHGQVLVARARLAAAVEKGPGDVNAPYDLGVLYQQRLHNSVLAARYFSDALRINPNYTPALNDLALVESRRDPKAAIALYNRLMVLSPNSPSVLWHLGLLLVEADSSSSPGHADLQQALSLDPALASQTPAGVTP